jgi:hypothetical protein
MKCMPLYRKGGTDMKDKLIKTLCDSAGEIAIGVGLLATGITCGVWGFMIGRYD